MKKLYHGTSINLNVGDSLEIAKATSRGKDPITGEYKPAIYATSTYKYAEFYALTRNGFIEDSFCLEPYGRPPLFILDSYDAAYAYVYELDGNNFYLEMGAGTRNEEYISFKDEKIIGKHKIGAKELLDKKDLSGKNEYEVRIKKANFQEGMDKIIKACEYEEQLKNPGQLDCLLAEYTINAKDML